MGSWPYVAFVDAPSPDAVVRLDLSGKVEHDGFSLGSAQYDGDPGTLGVDYGYRDGLSFTACTFDSEAVALDLLGALSRETSRATNWLCFQASASAEPVWFKTYRGAPGALSLEYLRNDRDQNYWAVAVPLVADGLAYGAETTLGTFTVNNDPAAGSNPGFLALGPVKGDAPAKPIVRCRYLNGAQGGYRHMLAVSPAPAGYTPITWQVGGTDGWTAGADTGASASDAAASGGTYRAVSFATTPGMATRISGTVPTAVRPGRYKVLVRALRSDTSSTFALRFGSTISFDLLFGDVVNWTAPASTAAKHATWVDLGDFTLPLGAALADLDDELPVSPGVAVQAARLSGTGSLWLDTVRLVPVGNEHSRTLYVDYTNLGPPALLYDEYHDASQEIVYTRNNGTGQLEGMYPPGLPGGFPVLVPGASNFLHFAEQTALARSQYAGSDVPDRLATQVSLEVTYHPRYQHLRGD